MKKGLKQITSLTLALCCMLCVLFALPVRVLAFPGTIEQDGTNVRAQTSTSSDVVGRLNAGQTIEIESEETDAAGQVWYRITVNGTTGYVRGDLVQTAGGGNAAAGTSTEAPTQVTSLSERKAVVSADTEINVRSGAGRNYASIAALQPNTEVTVTGEATAENGAKWYQVRYNGTNVGFIIEDFLTVSEPETPDPAEDPAAGATTAQDPVSAPVTVDPGANNSSQMMGQRYTVAYETDEKGEDVPYLHDNNSNAKWNVLSLIDDYNELVRLQGVSRTNTILRIVCIVLALFLVAAIVLLIMAGRRYRDLQDGSYEEPDDYQGNEDDYEDEGAEEEDYEEDEEDYEEEPRKKRGGFLSRLRRRRDDEYEDEEDEYEEEEEYEEEQPRAISRVYSPEPRDYGDDGGVVRPSRGGRRSRNFMEAEDEDDFDYPFMDDDE